MKVISIYSPKGGVGKTTIAVNLGGYYNKQGKNVMIVDTDVQASIESIYGIDSEIFKVVTKLPEEAPEGIDIMIIDHHPSHTKVPFGHFIVCPIEPSRLSWESYKNARHLFLNKKHLLVINMVDKRISDHNEFQSFISQQMKSVTIARRNVYARTTNEASTVFEMGHKSGAADGRNQIAHLASVIEANI